MRIRRFAPVLAAALLCTGTMAATPVDDGAAARKQAAQKPSDHATADKKPAGHRRSDPKPGDRKSRLLARMDRNGDGKISFEEYRNAMLRRFDARDKNHDGVLDGDEFPSQWLTGAAVATERKRITRDEFSDQLQPSFDHFDTDKDDQLDGAELDAFLAARQPEKQP
ncbi:MAG: hypothetical protein ABS97_01555 [Lysobacteraceae bacterium SCN 69-320]|nr:MAG: hypothetical protein ABS97_01555 [Xanthomonadaceae bacterium SCN 69-320]